MTWDLVDMALPFLWKGARITLIIAFFGVLLGFPLGVLAALVRVGRIPFLSRVMDACSALMRGTPMLVQIAIIYYGLGQLDVIQNVPALWWMFGDSLHCAILAVLLNTIAYTSEIFRGAFLGMDRGVVEAAKACGMSRPIMLWRITFPLALRQALPAYGNEVAIVIKESSLASTITVLEITGYAKRLMSETFAIVEIFAVASVFYLCINFFALFAVRCLERHLAKGMPAREGGFV